MSEAKFRMQYGAPAVLIGWLLTFLLFCVGLSANVVANEEFGSMGWGYLQLALAFGLPIAVIIGLPLGLLIAWPLRRVRNQWIHVAIFAVGVGTAMAALFILPEIGHVRPASVFAAFWAAASAAIGRASVIRLVARRNRSVPTESPRSVIR
jgi:hypothetical protein